MFKIFPEHLRLPQWVEIGDITTESSYVKSLYFESPTIASKVIAGQFLLVYVFNHLDITEEIPMSISYVNGGVIGISVRIAGPTTEALHKHSVGDIIGVRGPYGNGYSINGNRIAVVGGGIGMAPLMPIIENTKRVVDVYIGARSKDHVCFTERITSTSASLHIATDDGSSGTKGFVTDLLESRIRDQKYDQILTSGPELMIKRVLDICNTYGIPLQAGTERYIKCGRGVCGQCAIDNHLVCRDGPVFDNIILNKLRDFGKRAMDIAGESMPVQEVFNTRA